MRSSLWLSLLLAGCTDALPDELPNELPDEPPNEPPSVTLVSPTGTDVLYADLGIAVQATVSDDDHDLDELSVLWSSSLDGPLIGADVMDDSGGIAGQLDLSGGLHILTIEVEDPHGGVTTAQVAVDVAETNTPPRCAFTSPDANGAAQSGSQVDLSIAVDDADIGATALTVELHSDQDGDLGPVTVASDGAATLSVALSDGTHALTLVATDELGATCEASLLYSLGQPPSVAITAPTAEFVEDIGERITFSATVEDADNAPSELAISWSSNVDGQLSTAPVDSAGITDFTSVSLSRGDHEVTLRATDSLGLYDETTIALRVNGPPTAPVVATTPETPATNQPLTVVISEASTDAESDGLTYYYAWSRDGELVEDLTEDMVPAERTARDETWTVDVWASDGRLNGERSAVSTTIINTAPVADSVVLAPTSPTTNDVVTASVETSDLDSDPVSLTFVWAVNGADVVGVDGPSLDGATHFDKGDTVSVRVTPSDDGVDGDTLLSAAVTTINSPPSPPTIGTNPRFTYGDVDATCAIVEDSVDPDGDDITYTVTWTADGMAYPGDFAAADGPETVVHTDDTVLSVDQDLADTFTCTVTVTDGTVTTPEYTAFFDIIDGMFDVGYWREFPYTAIIARNYLLGHPVTVPNDMTVTELAIISKRTTSSGRIALYRDVDGVPTDLVVGSELQGINVGHNEFTVTPTPITAGTYWLMAAYDSTAYPAEDRGRNTVYYVAHSATSDVPSSIESPLSYSGYRHNYYLVGYE